MKLILVFLLAVLAADVSGQQQQQRPTLPPSSSSRLPSCPTNLPRIRREIHEISDQTTGQLNAKGQSFLKGVQCLQKTPSPSSGGSIWDEFIQVHLNVLTYAHNHAPFLPWHRMFLLTFEEAMRQCTNDSSITVP